MVERTDKCVSIAIFSRSHRSLGFEHRVDATDCQLVNRLAWRKIFFFCMILGRNGHSDHGGPEFVRGM